MIRPRIWFNYIDKGLSLCPRNNFDQVTAMADLNKFQTKGRILDNFLKKNRAKCR